MLTGTPEFMSRFRAARRALADEAFRVAIRKIESEYGIQAVALALLDFAIERFGADARELDAPQDAHRDAFLHYAAVLYDEANGTGGEGEIGEVEEDEEDDDLDSTDLENIVLTPELVEMILRLEKTIRPVLDEVKTPETVMCIARALLHLVGFVAGQSFCEGEPITIEQYLLGMAGVEEVDSSKTLFGDVEEPAKA